MKWFHFGIADFIQKNSDHEIFAILDGYNTLEQFFKNQQIVRFKDIFYARKYFHYAKNTKDETFFKKLNILIF